MSHPASPPLISPLFSASVALRLRPLAASGEECHIGKCYLSTSEADAFEILSEKMPPTFIQVLRHMHIRERSGGAAVRDLPERSRAFVCVFRLQRRQQCATATRHCDNASADDSALPFVLFVFVSISSAVPRFSFVIPASATREGTKGNVALPRMFALQRRAARSRRSCGRFLHSSMWQRK